MSKEIRSVTMEQQDLTFKTVLKAIFKAATGRVGEAKSQLQGEPKLVARDANGDLVIGISGGRCMTIFTNHEGEDAKGVIAPSPRENKLSL